MPSTKQEHLLWKEHEQEFYNLEEMYQNEALDWTECQIKRSLGCCLSRVQPNPFRSSHIPNAPHQSLTLLPPPTF